MKKFFRCLGSLMLFTAVIVVPLVPYILPDDLTNAQKASMVLSGGIYMVLTVHCFIRSDPYYKD